MICPVCGNQCAYHTAWSDAHNAVIPVIAENQTQPRAKYFDAEDNVDFCGPQCSTQYYQEKQLRNG